VGVGGGKGWESGEKGKEFSPQSPPRERRKKKTQHKDAVTQRSEGSRRDIFSQRAQRAQRIKKERFTDEALSTIQLSSPFNINT